MLHIRPIGRLKAPQSCVSSLIRAYATVQHSSASPATPIAPTSDTISQPLQSRIRDKNVILRTYKPRTPGVRHLKRPINDHLWKGKPYYPLTFSKIGHGKGGRNNTGQITVRHRGGGHRRRIRTVDFKRSQPGPQKVERIEYDPNRSAHLALLKNEATGQYSYIIAAEGMRAGDIVQSYRSGIPEDLLASMGGVVDPGMLAAKTAFRGNCLPLHLVPLGTQVYCVGSSAQRGAVFCRSAGTYAIVVAKEEGKRPKHVTVRLQSGEVRRVSKDACATIGVVSNPHWHFRQLGKAGRSRWLNIRPTVRGVAMNACKLILITPLQRTSSQDSGDHPHGGGRGKSKGNRHPVSPWGQLVSFFESHHDRFRANGACPGQRRIQDAEEKKSEQMGRSRSTKEPRQETLEYRLIPKP